MTTFTFANGPTINRIGMGVMRLTDQPGTHVMSLLYKSAEDLGPPGRDDIYGYGLLRVQGG